MLFYKTNKEQGVLEQIKSYAHYDSRSRREMSFEKQKFKDEIEQYFLNKIEENGKQNLDQFFKYKSFLDSFTQLCFVTSNACREMWELAQNCQSRFGQLRAKLIKLHRLKEKMNFLYEELSAAEFSSISFKKIFITFHDKVFINVNQKNRLMEQYKMSKVSCKIDFFKASSKSFQGVDNNQSCFVLLNGNKNRFGQIRFISQDIKDILKYDKSFMKFKTLDHFLLPQRRGVFLSYLQRLLSEESFKEGVKLSNLIEPFVTKGGYLRLCMVNLRFYPNFLQGLSFSCLLYDLNLDEKYSFGLIAYDRDSGEILGLNKNCFRKFGLKKYSKQIHLNLQYLCPDIMKPKTQEMLEQHFKIRANLYIKFANYYTRFRETSLKAKNSNKTHENPAQLQELLRGSEGESFVIQLILSKQDRTRVNVIKIVPSKLLMQRTQKLKISRNQGSRSSIQSQLNLRENKYAFPEFQTFIQNYNNFVKDVIPRRKGLIALALVFGYFLLPIALLVLVRFMIIQKYESYKQSNQGLYYQFHKMGLVMQLNTFGLNFLTFL